MTEWQIEPLGPHHVRSSFSSGVASLDEFIHNFITQYERRGLGRSYITTDANSQVVGYYTLCAGAITAQNLSSESVRRLPRHPVPVVLLARLAVDQSHQRTGLGSRLLKDAINRAYRVAKEIGAYAIQAQAVNDRAAAFYQKFGFVSYPSKPLDLYLTLATIEKRDSISKIKRYRND